MDKIVERLLAMAGEGATTDQVTQLLAVDGTALLREMLQGYLDRCAERERRVEVVRADGIEQREVRKASRRIETPAGEVEVRRMLYQAPGVDGSAPLDAALRLPDEKYTHEVAKLRPAAASPLVSSRPPRQLLPIISCNAPSVSLPRGVQRNYRVPRGAGHRTARTTQVAWRHPATASRKTCDCEPQSVRPRAARCDTFRWFADRVLAPDGICPSAFERATKPSTLPATSE